MRKWIFGLLILLLSANLTFAQDWTGQGRQIGYVYDEEGNPLEGVKIKLLFVKTGSGFEVATNDKGKWTAMVPRRVRKRTKTEKRTGWTDIPYGTPHS